MSKAHQPPVVEVSKTAVAEQEQVAVIKDTAIGVPSERVASTPVDIYKNGIDNLVKFLKHEIHAGAPAVRADYQAKYMDSIVPMLSMNDAQVAEVLNYFIVTIIRNPNTFSMSDRFAPLFHVKNLKTRPEDQMVQYKAFLSFMVDLAENAPRRKQYLAGLDIRKLLDLFPPKAQAGLANFAYA